MSAGNYVLGEWSAWKSLMTSDQINEWNRRDKRSTLDVLRAGSLMYSLDRIGVRFAAYHLTDGN